MELTKLINDVLSTFTSYIVDCAADPGYMSQIKKHLEDTCKGAADVDEIVSHMEQLVGDIVAMSAQTKDYLTVYKSEPCEPYSGGMALIAANTSEEFDKIIEDLNEKSWGTYSNIPCPIAGLRYTGEPGVIIDRTYRE